MPDKSRTQWIIDKILASPKLAGRTQFDDKIYRDEPLVMTGTQFGNTAPAKIREMRRIANTFASREKIFLEQGRFMADYQDDYEYPGEFQHYYPTYQDMTDAQLRGYFSWRTNVRRGRVEKTSLSFAFVYIYELLNQIGTAAPEAGFHDLLQFWSAYRRLDDRISSYVEMWLKDYVIYNRLDKSLLKELPCANSDKAVEILLDYMSYRDEEVFAALNALSTYDLENSRFYQQYREEVRNVALRVFSALSDYYNKSPKKKAPEKIFGRVTQAHYHMFKAAVFYHVAERGDRIYEINPYSKYCCHGGEWYCERFIWYGNNNKQIGEILRSVDFLMRQKYGFKSTLQDGKTNKILKAKIIREIAAYFEEKRTHAPVRVDIDISKLRGIRETARTTRDKLLVEEEREASAAKEKLEPPRMVEAETENAAGLNAAEILFLKCLLDRTSYAGLLKENGLMLSVFVDGINEKLMSVLNDTAIIYEDDRPLVLKDYVEDLHRILPA